MSSLENNTAQEREGYRCNILLKPRTRNTQKAFRRTQCVIHNAAAMPKVTFHYDGQTKTVEGPEGETILQIALDNGIPIEHACGGNGFCTTCMCKVKKGMEHLSARSDREENMGVTDDPDRLSCQCKLGSEDTEVEMVEF